MTSILIQMRSNPIESGDWGWGQSGPFNMLSVLRTRCLSCDRRPATVCFLWNPVQLRTGMCVLSRVLRDFRLQLWPLAGEHLFDLFRT